MIGNDVIDLALVKRESNWRRKGFLQKLFNDDEREMIRSSDNPDWLVWNFWSRKEAVYKIINRETGMRGFFPLQINCLTTEEGNGTCTFNGSIYYTRTFADSEMMHTIAATGAVGFQKLIEISDRSLIHKTGGLPFYRNCPASISHHGRFEKIIALEL